MKSGLSYALQRAAAVTPGLFLHRYAVVRVPVEGMPAMPRGYGVQAADAEVLAGRIDAPEDVIAARFAAGLTALAAHKGDEMVGVNWVTAAPFDEDEVRVRWVPPEGYAWDTGLWIAPERRMTRAFAALWAGTADWLRARGLSGSASRIADYNAASLSSHEAMQAERLGTVTVAGLGAAQIASAGDRRFTTSARPIIDTGTL
ncbi:MAG: hypothetical protein V2J26_08340 [Pacificimonas sp.]|jgi:hypothetical protein|nr:hypothetical protein [Pacificimonas sp.]